MISTMIRICLTIGLLTMVFKETGPWTTVCFTLFFIASEISTFRGTKVTEKLQEQSRKLRVKQGLGKGKGIRLK